MARGVTFRLICFAILQPSSKTYASLSSLIISSFSVLFSTLCYRCLILFYPIVLGTKSVFVYSLAGVPVTLIGLLLVPFLPNCLLQLPSRRSLLFYAILNGIPQLRFSSMIYCFTFIFYSQLICFMIIFFRLFWANFLRTYSTIVFPPLYVCCQVLLSTLLALFLLGVYSVLLIILVDSIGSSRLAGIVKLFIGQGSACISQRDTLLAISLLRAYCAWLGWKGLIRLPSAV